MMAKLILVLFCQWMKMRNLKSRPWIGSVVTDSSGLWLMTSFYPKENLITILNNPPRPVIGRHVEIEPDVWELVEKEEDE